MVKLFEFFFLFFFGYLHTYATEYCFDVQQEYRDIW